MIIPELLKHEEEKNTIFLCATILKASCIEQKLLAPLEVKVY